jgi:hypothetical protein
MPRTIQSADPVESLKQHPALDTTTAGRRVHQAIGRLLDAGVRAPASIDVIALARDIVCEPGLAVVRRQAAIQRLATTTASYFRFFALDETWTYLGSELTAKDCRFDFVFEGADGTIVVDELKSGGAADRGARRLFDEQIDRQVDAGTAKWCERFLGVRVLLLAAPRASFLARPDGERETLEWGGRQ